MALNQSLPACCPMSSMMAARHLSTAELRIATGMSLTIVLRIACENLHVSVVDGRSTLTCSSTQYSPWRLSLMKTRHECGTSLSGRKLTATTPVAPFFSFRPSFFTQKVLAGSRGCVVTSLTNFKLLRLFLRFSAATDDEGRSPTPFTAVSSRREMERSVSVSVDPFLTLTSIVIGSYSLVVLETTSVRLNDFTEDRSPNTSVAPAPPPSVRSPMKKICASAGWRFEW
mmetsp:Transcript_31459/g.65172  ORF Transcript_31459/g.65172 Transcript_31459/m.65172 type:complete len:228 (-) Transcript_31459:512-1195(-)